jgi:hypothetical protein
MFRVPLWPVTTWDSHPVGSRRAEGIPVVEVHELAAGKLVALLARRQARDLRDAHRLLQREDLDRERLRLAFVLYGAMNRRDWRTVGPEEVGFDPEELTRRLLPVLRRSAAVLDEGVAAYGERLARECREMLSVALPLSASEREFLDLLLDGGKIDPTLLTPDGDLQERIRRHPLLEWKALNARGRKRR